MAQTRPPSSASAPRSPVILGLLLAYLAYQGFALWANLQCLEQPTSGFGYHVHVDGIVHAFPLTAAAARAVADLDEARLHLVEVNGEPVRGTGARAEDVDAALVHVEGEPNAFVFLAEDGSRTEARILAEYPRLSSIARASPMSILFPLVGFLYMALGVLVWWRRPGDRGSTPLLLFALVPGVHLTFNLYATPATRHLEHFSQSVPPLYGPALLYLALQFTGFHRRPALRWALRASVATAVLLCASNLLSWSAGLVLDGDFAYRAALGSSVLAALFLTVGLSIAASRAPHPLALRRRAKALGIAALVAFFIPSLTLFVPVGGEWAYVTVAMLASFPAIIGYAIVRLGMFDIRVVLGQGLIYVSLSVAVLVGYLVLVALAFHTVDAAAGRPLVMGALVVTSVIGLSLVQMRVQGMINRLVFRSRYLLGDALALASHQLLRTHSTKQALDTLRGALLDTVQLSRAAVATRDGDDALLDCRVLGSRPDPITGELPAPLPERLDPARHAPIARALSSEQPISTHDSQVASVLVAGASGVQETGDGSDEASFWPHYGIEWIVPITLRKGDAGEREAAGVLLLGPKLDGRALDASDRALMVTLANQLGVAIENARAFEEIQRLKDGLEAQVQERTRDLSEALSDLKQTQAHLVESEKQAMLGRVVAGIVHEVNSPLGSLRSSVDTTDRLLTRMRGYLERHAAEGDAEAHKLLTAIESGAGLLSVMQDSGERIGGLVESLKRFVSLDESEMRPLDVCEGIDSALTLLSPVLGDGIVVHRDYPKEPPVVRCYPARLNQVFLNVIENAASAIEPDGHGEVRIGVSNGSGRVTIEVADNGRGIEPERIASLLDFGFTQKAGRVRMRLGLPSNKRAVEELGGELTIESRVGAGTCVRIALPA